MNQKHPKTITLQEFAKDFTPEQKEIANDEIKYYELLAQIKETREKKGLSQEELAQRAHVNRTSLSQIESGIRNATIDTLSRIAAAMDMKLEVRLKAL